MGQVNVLDEALSRRRDRAIAIMLGVKERECDSQLSNEARTKMRKVILDQMNDFHGFCVDILKSYEGGSDVILNEQYLDKLDAMHEMMTELAARD